MHMSEFLRAVKIKGISQQKRPGEKLSKLWVDCVEKDLRRLGKNNNIRKG